MNFLSGLKLSGKFYEEAARPILDREFPGLEYSAGLLGYGSDVLGYDDQVSTDHMWGPRFYLFLSEKDMEKRGKIQEAFENMLPYSFLGYSVNFSAPDPEDHGVRRQEWIREGKVSPLIFIHSFPGFSEEYLGVKDPADMSPEEWLACSEHRLLGITSGKLFYDGLNLEAVRKQISFYPDVVRDYLLASCWAVIGQEQAFVKRCGARGDEIGSRLAAARIADRLIHLCFLYEGKYAPYSKWIGTAFEKLKAADKVREQIRRALRADQVEEREEALVRAQQETAQLHNRSGLTDPVSTEIHRYFGRDILVIDPDETARKLQERLKGTALEAAPLIGTLSQVGNLTEITEDTRYRPRIRSLYRMED